MNSLILIVDDEAFMIRLIESSMRKGGFDILSCRSGEHALELAAEHHPALIIMDLMMPGMDGLATLRCIKENESLRSVPVIMLTAKGHKLTKETAQASGADAFLTKPFSPSHLVEEVRSLIEKRKLP